MHNSNPRGSEILVWHVVGDSCVSWVERTLKPWLPTFLREENCNIKSGASESLALVGNHLEMVRQKEYWW